MYFTFVYSHCLLYHPICRVKPSIRFCIGSRDAFSEGPGWCCKRNYRTYAWAGNVAGVRGVWVRTGIREEGLGSARVKIGLRLPPVTSTTWPNQQEGVIGLSGRGHEQECANGAWVTEGTRTTLKEGRRRAREAVDTPGLSHQELRSELTKGVAIGPPLFAPLATPYHLQ